MKRKGVRIPVCLFCTHRFLLKQFCGDCGCQHSGSSSLNLSAFYNKTTAMLQTAQNIHSCQYAVYTFYHRMPELASLFAILQKFRSFRQFHTYFLCKLTITKGCFRKKYAYNHGTDAQYIPSFPAISAIIRPPRYP